MSVQKPSLSRWIGIMLKEFIQLKRDRLTFGMIVGIPIGVYAALKQDTIGDYILRSVSILALAIPAFWTGTLVMVFPSIWWGWSPSVDYIAFFANPTANLSQMLLPGIVLGAASIAVVSSLALA